MGKKNFLSEEIKLVINDDIKNFVKAPPRTHKHLKIGIDTFINIKGSEWGFGTKLTKIQKFNRAAFGYIISIRDYSNKPESNARNYYKAMERLGLIYLDENKRINITQAGMMISNPNISQLCILQQLIKYMPYQFNFKENYIEYNPTFIFSIFFKKWYKRFKDSQSNEIVFITFEEFFKTELSYLTEETARTYFRTFINWISITSTILYDRSQGYTFLFDEGEADDFYDVLEIIRKDVQKYIESIESWTFSSFFEYYGTIHTSYSTLLEKFVLEPNRKIMKISNITTPTQYFTKKVIDNEKNDFIKEKMIEKNIDKEIIALNQNGISSIQIQLNKKSLYNEIRKRKYTSKPEIIENDLYISQLNEETIQILSEDLTNFINELNYGIKAKPAIITAYEFEDSIKWLLWNLNRKSISGEEICIIPLFLNKLHNLTKVHNSANNFIPTLQYFSRLASEFLDPFQWFDSINNVVDKIPNIFTGKTEINSEGYLSKLKENVVELNEELASLKTYLNEKLTNLQNIEEDKELSLYPISEEFKDVCLDIVLSLYQKFVLSGLKIERPIVVPDEDGDVGFQIRTDKLDVVLLVENGSNHIIISADDYSDNLIEYRFNKNKGIEVLYTWVKQILI